MFWAQELAAQTEDPALAATFASLAKTLADNEAKIVAELAAVQGKPADIGGYFMPDAFTFFSYGSSMTFHMPLNSSS